jgi:hypothetical protein
MRMPASHSVPMTNALAIDDKDNDEPHFCVTATVNMLLIDESGVMLSLMDV